MELEKTARELIPFRSDISASKISLLSFSFWIEFPHIHHSNLGLNQHTLKIPRNNINMTTGLTGARLEQALVSLTTPTELLKFGHAGKPKFRPFRLSRDFSCLMWDSTTKKSDKTKIPIITITQIQFGQRSKVFMRNKRPDLDHLSFFRVL